MKATLYVAAAAAAASLAFGAFAQSSAINPTARPDGGTITSTAGNCNTATGNAIAAGNLGGSPTNRVNNCAKNEVPTAAVVAPAPAPVAVAPAAPAPMPMAAAPAPAPAPMAAAPMEPAPAPMRMARADRG